MHTYSGQCWDDRGSHYSLWRRQEGGGAQPQAVRWVRPAWNLWWRTRRDTRCTYVLTHAHWISLADGVIMIVSHTFIFFVFWWEQSLLSSLFLSESLTVSARTRKHKDTRTLDVTYPFNLYFCVSIFPPPPLLLVYPWHDRAPLSFGPPWLPVSQQTIGTGAHLPF